ncbi:polyprenyl synthetase family protein [Streptomyces sp. E11-3]|uniref:polyprenyl synthetase family protein n=1 Tax=Streptomyces sp. E11-3 TaxID=3110112 RepID=UPI0039812D8D
MAGAVAVELLHNFTLLHDDIMDGDRTRRHRSAAWVEFGVPTALLTGDALLVLALRVVTDQGIRRQEKRSCGLCRT